MVAQTQALMMPSAKGVQRRETARSPKKRQLHFSGSE